MKHFLILSLLMYSLNLRTNSFLLQVLDMRHIESQVLHEETASEQGSVVGHIEPGRRVMAPPHAGAPNTDRSPMYSFNLSFEELSTVGLDDPQRHGNIPWMVNIKHYL